MGKKQDLLHENPTALARGGMRFHNKKLALAYRLYVGPVKRADDGGGKNEKMPPLGSSSIVAPSSSKTTYI